MPIENNIPVILKTATHTEDGLMSAADKIKLDNITDQDKLTLNATNIIEDSTHRFITDTQLLQLNSKTNTKPATTETNGLMCSEDKLKLDNIADKANNYIHPEYNAVDSGLYKVTVDNTGHISNAINVTKEDIIILGIPEQDTTYSIATKNINGLMSAADKTKLDQYKYNDQCTNIDSLVGTNSTYHVVTGTTSGTFPSGVTGSFYCITLSNNANNCIQFLHPCNEQNSYFYKRVYDTKWNNWTSIGKYTYGTAAPSGGNDGDMYFQFID